MKVIITSGGTSEKIDDVRMITNTSTGRLGGIIAKSFYEIYPDVQIYYLCSKNAYIPNIDGLLVVTISDAASLLQEIERLLTTEKIDAVIHAMAVSDYCIKSISTAESITNTIVKQIESEEHNYKDLYDTVLKAIINSTDIDRSTKIKSNYDNLMLTFDRTPKIIARIKKLQSSTILVGFKLLNKVTEDQLIDVGYKLLIKNNCDFVLANDLQSVQEGNHTGFLIRPDKTYIKLITKEKIAEEIVLSIIKK